ncbi:MAG: DUF4136 domain-containing protein, partial [Alcaligenes sp.]
MTILSTAFSMRAARLAALGLVALATGCAAPSWSAKLTRYQQWPAQTNGETYRLMSTDAQRGN